MYALTKFRHYVFGTRFLIQTDHKPLQGLLRTKDPQGRLARWINALQEYDYVMEYRKGKANANADALSRLAVTASIGMIGRSDDGEEEKRENDSAEDQANRASGSGWDEKDLDLDLDLEQDSYEEGCMDIDKIPQQQQDDPMWRDIYRYVAHGEHNEQ